MSFADLAERFDDQLHLPINGVTYDIPAPDHETGLLVTAMVTAGSRFAAGDRSATLPKMRFEGEDGDDESEEAGFYRKVLGPVYRQLREDGVSWPRIRMVAETTCLWIAGGIKMAEEYWNTGGNPKAPEVQAEPANRAARRAQASTSTAAASTTRPRGSGSGTKSR